MDLRQNLNEGSTKLIISFKLWYLKTGARFICASISCANARALIFLMLLKCTKHQKRVVGPQRICATVGACAQLCLMLGAQIVMGLSD